jgi:hypothetical protein
MYATASPTVHPTRTGAPRLRSRKANLVLWVLQSLLAALFLFAGGMKLVLPIAEMTQQLALPGALLRFVGVAEVLGALGLILPGALRIAPRLTALAALGLLAIMIGATTVSFMSGGLSAAIVPCVVGVLCAWIAYCRSGTCASNTH